MHFRTRTWFAISLLCFLVAAIFWQLAERKAARDKAARENAAPAASATPAATPTPAAQPAPLPAAAAAQTNAVNVATNPFPHRLSNTAKSVEQLVRSDQALLLRNALIDSSAPLNLAIPPHLRSDGDPGAYVVQARGSLTDAFRAALRQAGAEIVAYVPNNAYLVRASDAAARQLAALAQTQAVLPWEPYYKLDPALLEAAIGQTPLPSGTRLNVLLFPEDRERVMRALDAAEATVLGEERSPFGPQLLVRLPENGLVALARLPGVQVIEKFFPRKAANDLARERVSVSTNTVTTATFRNLTGEGVLVNVNDTGVQAMHPHLTGRVTGDSPFTLADPDGHGTHVAGTLAGSASDDSMDPQGVPGSRTNASFRGIAPLAKIFALPLDRTFGPNVSDAYLQETPASTNILISNNSWGYFGSASYNLSAASWDAAVRDALPGATGQQPLLAVFAAGNSGFGGIDSPGTAKNVITVGAIENLRLITNETVRGTPPDLLTNQPWLALTDSTNTVAAFSSVGNIGRNQEGPAGRFKPDLVAPGAFVVSTRRTGWRQPTNSISETGEQIPFERIRSGRTNQYQTFIPANGRNLRIECVPNGESLTVPLPPLHLHVRASTPPTSADFVGLNQVSVPTTGAAPDTWYFSIANTNRQDVYLHVRFFIALENDVGNELIVLDALQETLGPHYRFETGTSMAAPVVSGLLALMQEAFKRDLSTTNPSPALLKALLINGARTLGTPYSYSVTNTLNEQGWGLPNITNALPESGLIAGGSASAVGTVVFIEQTPDRALVTGQSLTWDVDATPLAQNGALRFTLVWTDPPGSPAVGVKLVNDLDLVVSNKTTRQTYYGNAFRRGSEFVGSVPIGIEVPSDVVNNVENVFIDRRQGGQFAVTVNARRVNVDAVHTNGATAQDFALVISCDNRRTDSTITVAPGSSGFQASPLVHVLTNGVPTLNQRLGANSPFLVTTNGVTNQWRFYVATNTLPPSDPLYGLDAAATNIAFFTFQPPNLSLSRSNLADIDLFVSDNPAITNLDPTVIAGAFRGVGRGGTEAVILPNVNPGTPYYVGVKSEDQQAASFGIAAISSSAPFSSTDSNGVIVARGYTLPAAIPDGEPTAPQAALVFVLISDDVPVKNVVVTNALTHEHVSDLIGVLQHNGIFSVLNNHTPSDYAGFIEWIFDDSDSGNIPFSEPTHSPGTLRNFVGDDSAGLWQLSMVDDSAFFTGQVEDFVLRIEPRRDDELIDGAGVVVTIQPGRWDYTPIDVPADATNLLVCVSPDEAPLEVYIARGFFPNRTDFDSFAVIAPPGDCLSLGRRDVPPLSQGRYFIGVFNPNTVPVNMRIRVFIQRDLTARSLRSFRSDFAKELLDDAVTNSTIFVGRRGVIADVSVGVRLLHPRVSDLVLHLVSPQGTRLLLAENRGALTADYGFGSLVTNVFPVSSTGGPAESRKDIGPVDTEGVLQVDYQFFTARDRMTVYYENVLIFDSGLINGAGTFSIDYGPGFSTNIVIIMNEGNNPNTGTAWRYTATVVSGYDFATFTDDTNFARVPIKFALPPFTNFNYFATNFFTNATLLDDGFEDPRPLTGADEFTIIPAGVISGWNVDLGDVTLLGTGATNAPSLTAPHTGVRFIDIGMGIVSTNLPTTPGLGYQVSFVYAHNPANSLDTFADIFVQDTNGSFIITTHNVTAAASDPPGLWRTNAFSFQAIAPATQILIASSSSDPAAVFFDTFKVEQVDVRTNAGIYFQPEEPMTEKPFGRFVGENAFGPWTLEVWDNRVGAGVTNSLLAWKLNLTFVNTNPPTVTLTNGLEYCSTLRSNETAYFLVNVPISAGAATNILTASENVNLRYNAVGLPTGAEPPDTLFFADEPEGTAILDGGGWNSFDANGRLLGAAFAPQLRPGFRYYLAVENRFPGTNAFCLKVQFDSTDPTLVPIIVLTNLCQPGFIGAGGASYYALDVGSNSIGAEFSISNIMGGDVNLYVKRNLPVPSPTRFFARSENAPPMDYEFIQVADFTSSLLPGRWYLAVVGAAGSSYNVCAREIPGPVTPLAVNVTNCATVNTSAVHYYKVLIASNAFQADFRTIAGNSNLDLFISQSTMSPLLTSPTNALFASTNTPSGDELISLSVFTNTASLTPGLWYLAVVNKTNVPVDYCVIVNQFTTNIDYITLTNGVPYLDRVSPGDLVGFYRFDVATNALQIVFDTFSADGDVDLYVRYGFPLPPPGTNQFQFASTNLLTTNEWIGLHLDNTNALPRPGSYWIAVLAKNPADTVNFKVRATQILRSEVPQLVNGVRVCDPPLQPVDTNALHSGVHFYRFDVSSNAVQALFETFNADGNVDLFVQYGLPITNYSLLLPPARGNFTNSENAGLANESICLLTNSSPFALRAGTWYVAVVNRDTNDVTYCVRASAVTVQPLADGVTDCDFLRPTDGSPVNGIRFYTFTAASNAVQVTFETLAASRNVDLYVRKAPTNLVDCGTFSADLSGWTYASTNVGLQAETICLLTNSPVPLSGGDWYVAVVNRDTTTNFANYCVRATQLLPSHFTPVTSGMTTCRTNLGVGNGAMNAGIDYLLLTVTNGPALMTFETFDATGNVDLFVGLADTNLCLPNFAVFNPALTNYPYASVHRGLAPECVTLETNTAPVALTNGVWFVAVVNREPTNGVNYCFLATEFATNPTVRLTNGVAACPQTVPGTAPGSVGVNYYVFNVSSNALRATFETFVANGNVDIYLQYGFCFPHRDAFGLGTINGAYASTNAGATDEFICLDGGSFPAPLKPGDWYVAVVNREAAPVNFCLRATELLDAQVVALTNGVAHTPTNTLASGGVDFYRYRVSTNAVQVNFEAFPMSANVELFVDYGFCSSNALTFTYASTNGGTTNELIVVATNAAPVPLAPGDWIIAVKNTDLVPATYTVRVTEILASQIIRLTNALPYTNTVSGLGTITNFPVNYYVFNVSTNAVRAQFEILGPSNNVNLVARKGLPLPSLASHDLASTNAGASAELMVLFTNSTPVALSPGDWFLTVLNATTNATRYAVVATEYAAFGTNVSIAPGGISLVSNLFCLTWTNILPGVNYHVQGKANLNDPAWVPVSPTIRATTNFITWCIQLPSPYRFFRLSEGLSPVSVGGQLAFTSMRFGTNGLNLNWTAPPNLRYVAEWTPTFAPPAWRPFPDYITSTNTAYSFTDDGSMTGGLGTNRFYRFFLVP